MIINVANPICDSVLKYLMEDERVSEMTGLSVERLLEVRK